MRLSVHRNPKKEVLRVRKFTFLAIAALALVLVFGTTAFAALQPGSQNGTGYQSPTGFLGPGLGTEGTNIVIPADPATNRIHSQYTKNTNACASCHVAHTAVGADLLQWSDPNATCLACHDGTVTATYDVDKGFLPGSTTARTAGGLFNLTVAEGVYDQSRHAVTASLNTAAAPGGAGSSAPNDSNGTWTEAFECVSCHSPHGQGGNARILSPDPNGLSVSKRVPVNTDGSWGTAYTTSPYKGFTMTADAADTSGKTFLAVVPAAGDHQLGYKPGEKYTFIRGYPYSKLTKVYVNAVAKTETVDFTFDNSAGYTKVVFTTAPATTDTVTADFVPALRVKMSYTGYLTSTESISYKGGLNAFCGACHTDYNTATAALWNVRGDLQYHGSATTLTGTYKQAYRHQVGYNYSAAVNGAYNGLKFETKTVVCLTCHVAHGTNDQYWVDSLAGADSGFWTSTTAVETMGSSVLKRKPNMGVCETCHKKGDGNQGYLINTQ